VIREQQRVQWLTDLIRLEIMLWDRIDAALKQQHDLPLSAFETMYMIDRAPGAALRVGDLAQRLRVTTGAASKLADRIERAGWIRRDADPADRRVSRLVLTGEGGTLLAAAVRTYAAELAGTVDPVLGDHDQQHLHDLVRRLLDHGKHA
jgi:MarR family transcriptional regulator, organic hydroperoxide resistance regulator